MDKINIAIGCDHAGFELKQEIIGKYDCDYNFIDFGATSSDSVDYPIYGHKVGLSIVDGKALIGFVICGSGIGISISANKVKGIRAALCTSVEHAKLSRLHNNANVLAIGARLTKKEQVFDIIETFINTNFEGGRHQDRLEKIEL